MPSRQDSGAPSGYTNGDRRISMFRRPARLVLPLVLLAALPLLAGCSLFGSEGQGSENVFNTYVTGDIPDLDSTTSDFLISGNILNNVMEGLFRVDDELEPYPAQAESFEVSEDGRTYTFTLREGLEWSNGDPVTAADFRYAWLRAINPETADAPAYQVYEYITGGREYFAGEAQENEVGIRAPDDRTLIVELENPTPYFPSLLASSVYLPLNEEFVEEQGEEYALSADGLLYNGPFTMTELDPANQAVLSRNGSYWDAENVALEGVNMRVIKESATAVNLYESGELDFVGLSAEDVERLQDSEEFSTVQNSQTYFLYMNNEDPTLANADIRKAIQLGFDKRAYAEVIMGDGSEPAPGLVPDIMPGPGEETFREFADDPLGDFDPEAAREYWERGVEELGETPTLELTVGDDSASRDLATFVQSQLEESLGAETQILVRPFEALFDEQESGDYQMNAWSWTAGLDPILFLELWESDSPLNDSGFASEEYDDLIQEVRRESDQERRMTLMAEAERLLVQEEAALAPIIHPASANLVKPNVSPAVDEEAANPYIPASEYKEIWLEEG